MGKTVTLDERHYQFIADKSRARGQTPEEYLQALIDADARTFDEILAPIRQGFNAMTDEEVYEMWDRAKKAARATE